MAAIIYISFDLHKAYCKLKHNSSFCIPRFSILTRILESNYHIDHIWQSVTTPFSVVGAYDSHESLNSHISTQKLSSFYFSQVILDGIEIKYNKTGIKLQMYANINIFRESVSIWSPHANLGPNDAVNIAFLFIFWKSYSF